MAESGYKTRFGDIRLHSLSIYHMGSDLISATPF